MKRQIGMIAIAIVLGACGTETDRIENSTKKIDRSVMGDKADGFVNATLSCTDACGALVQDETGYCGCDDLCTELGDCCADKADLCEEPEKETTVIRQSQDGETVNIKVGDTIDVQLDGNPTTGYAWQLMASSRSFPLQNEEYVPDMPELTGSGGTYHFYFTADTFSMHGTFHLQFAYFRSWEGADSALETFSVTVEVKSVCSPVMCELYCVNGFKLGEDGCEICQCKELTPCGGIAGLMCPDDYHCKLDGNYPDAMGVCVLIDESKEACLNIDEDYQAKVALSQSCDNDSECQLFVGGSLTCGQPQKAINSSAKGDVQLISDAYWDSQCYKLDWNCPLFSPLPPWYITVGTCKQGTCEVETIDTRAAEGEACNVNENYQCGDNLYCAFDVCLKAGDCNTLSDCYNVDNFWIHPACGGVATCEENRCGWDCS